MGRLTLRLPDSLHHELEVLAEQEQVSLNQYIVYALARQTTLAYTVQAVPERVLAEQRSAYAALLQNLGPASFDAVQATLAARDPVAPEPELAPEVIARFQQRIAERQARTARGAQG